MSDIKPLSIPKDSDELSIMLEKNLGITPDDLRLTVTDIDSLPQEVEMLFTDIINSTDTKEHIEELLKVHPIYTNNILDYVLIPYIYNTVVSNNSLEVPLQDILYSKLDIKQATINRVKLAEVTMLETAKSELRAERMGSVIPDHIRVMAEKIVDEEDKLKG